VSGEGDGGDRAFRPLPLPPPHYRSLGQRLSSAPSPRRRAPSPGRPDPAGSDTGTHSTASRLEDTHTETHTHTVTHTHTQRHTDTHTQRHTHTHTLVYRLPGIKLDCRHRKSFSRNSLTSRPIRVTSHVSRENKRVQLTQKLSPLAPLSPPSSTRLPKKLFRGKCFEF